jgi:FSR family fosmidomycin resistance protein-like MFS transporter
VSFCHLLNDVMQSLLASLYPLFKANYALDFVQIGLLTMAFQVTASLLQPLVGMVTDKLADALFPAGGMALDLIGLILLGNAGNFALLLMAACLIGFGSAIFHPESSRVAGWPPAAGMAWRNRCSRSAAISARPWGRCWRPSSSCPSARAASPGSRSSRCWVWSSSGGSGPGMRLIASRMPGRPPPAAPCRCRRGGSPWRLLILVLLTATKNVYMASISSYFTFYVIDQFQLGVRERS